MGWQDAPLQQDQPAWKSAPLHETVSDQLSKSPKDYMAQDHGAGLAALGEFVQPLTLGFGKRIQAGIAAPMVALAQGTDPNDEYNNIRASQELTRKNNPVGAAVGTGSGLVASLPLLLEQGGANALSKVGNFIRGGEVAADAGIGAKAANLALQSLRSASVAVPTGAVYRYGDAPEGQRLDAVKQGIGMDAAVGVALPFAAPIIDAGVGLAGGVKEAVGRLTSTGQQKIVGRLLNEAADNPEAVLTNLRNIQEYVPNSPITTGEASGDAGIAGLQRSVRNKNAGNPFSDIESQQNTARNVLLDDAAKMPADLKAAEAARGDNAKDLYTEAFNAGPVSSDRLQNFMETPELQAGIKRGLQIQRLESVAQGKKFDPTEFSVTGFNEAGDPIIGKIPNMRLLDAGKKGIDAMIADNTDITGKVNELGRALTQFKGSYLNELDTINPAYKSARANFAEMSKPITNLKTAQDIQNKISLTAAPDIQSGYSFLSQPKLTGLLRDPELRGSLSADQLSKLENIEKDMVRSASLSQRNVRPSGSDTSANLSNAAGSLVVDHALDKIPILGKALKSATEKGLNEQLVNALRNPDVAAKLMKTAEGKKLLFKESLKLPPAQGLAVLDQFSKYTTKN